MLQLLARPMLHILWRYVLQLQLMPVLQILWRYMLQLLARPVLQILWEAYVTATSEACVTDIVGGICYSY